jgi:ssDNA-binding Zn-finger/Zn-ribbon topoisomerase 1
MKQRCKKCGGFMVVQEIDDKRVLVCINELWGNCDDNYEEECEPFSIGSLPEQLGFGKKVR